MKKILLLGTVCALTVSGYAQGLISINGSGTHVISVNNGTSTITMPATAGAYIFDVLQYIGVGAPTVNSSLDLTSTSWIDTTVLGGTGTGPKAGQVTGALTATAANWANGLTAYDIVVGWSSTEGTTWAQISAAITGNNWANVGPSATSVFGYSLTGQTTSATSPANGASVWSGISGGFVLQQVAVPEPATIALAGLGGLSLLALRRKK